MNPVHSRRIRRAVAILAIAGVASAGTWYWREYLRWFPARELDRAAAPTGFIVPDFPANHGKAGYLGRLRIDVYIDDKGAVDRVELVESTLPPIFEERAREAFMRAKFEPAQRHGHAVRSVKRLELDVEPPDPASGRSP